MSTPIVAALIDCPTCEGEGEIQHGEDRRWDRTTCERCDGSGNVPAAPILVPVDLINQAAILAARWNSVEEIDDSYRDAAIARAIDFGLEWERQELDGER